MDDRTRTLLADAQNAAREQLTSALERIFDARMSGLSQKLNQSVRRLRNSGTPAQWANALVDATQGLCERAIVFQVEGDSLRIQAARNAGTAHFADSLPLQHAPAFRSAVENKDTVVALRTKGEMSQPLAAWLGEAAGKKFYAIPIVTQKNQVAGILYTDGEPNIDSGALELLAAVAGSVHEDRPAVSAPPADLIEILPAPIIKKPDAPWLRFSPQDQELHLRAQRFARVQVAEIRLHNSDRVKIGRTERNLYASLKVELDSARETYRRDFLSSTDTMVDYLHLELVKTLANEDVSVLGADYPGPMDEVHA